MRRRNHLDRRWFIQFSISLDHHFDRLLQYLPGKTARLHPASIPAAALLTAYYLHPHNTLSHEDCSHALLCALLMVGGLMAPFAMVKQAPPLRLQIGMMITGGFIAATALVMVRREGARALHFVTLMLTIPAVAFLLRPAAATIDRTDPRGDQPAAGRTWRRKRSSRGLQRETPNYLWAELLSQPAG